MQTQLRLADALLAKELGIEKVLSHNTTFIEMMRRLARKISAESGCVTIDELRDYCYRNALAPDDPHAWGSVFRGKGWRKIGYKPSEFVSNHGRNIPIWKYENQ